MTLCVAWNAGDQIHLASDSRISDVDRYSDNAIKILPLTIKVFTPTDSETGEAAVAFSRIYGMCFSGSFLGAYALREFLGIQLQQLQFIPTYIEISFAQICRNIEKFYKYFTQKLYTDLDRDHSIDFFLAGYCPAEKRLKIAKFYIDYGPDVTTYTPKLNIIDNTKSFLDAIGTGEESFRSNFKSLHISALNIKVLTAVKKTIDDQKVESVGGNIQYGSFDHFLNFKTSGIIIRDYDESGLLKRMQHCIAGINMMGDEFDSRDTELFMMGSYIDPFGKK